MTRTIKTKSTPKTLLDEVALIDLEVSLEADQLPRSIESDVIPVSVMRESADAPVTSIPGIGDVVFERTFTNAFAYGSVLRVAEMPAWLEWRADTWRLKLKIVGIPLTAHALADLEEKIRRIGEFFFGEGFQIVPVTFQLALGFRCEESLASLVQNADVKATKRQLRPDGFGYVFGSKGGGTQVVLSLSTGTGRSSAEKNLGLVFGRRRILETLRGMRGLEGSDEATLSPLVRELVRSAVGDADGPGFVRLVDAEPRAWPLYRRPTSALWKDVQRSLLDPSAKPEISNASHIEPSGL